MNIQNIKKMIASYLIENGRRDLINISFMMMIITFILAFMTRNITGPFVIASFLIIYYTSRKFWQLGKASANIHYLTLPASTLDKLASNFVITNIFYVIEAFGGVFLGYLLFYLVLQLPNFSEINFSFRGGLPDWTFKNNILPFYTALAIFFFGSIYFKKRALGKTILYGIGIFFSISIICFITMWLNFRFTIPDFEGFLTTRYNFPSSGSVNSAFSYVFCIAIILFSYVLSYFRLRETEA